MPCFVNQAYVPRLVKVSVGSLSRFDYEVLHLLGSLGCVDLDFVLESLPNDFRDGKLGLLLHPGHLLVGLLLLLSLFLFLDLGSNDYII